LAAKPGQGGGVTGSGGHTVFAHKVVESRRTVRSAGYLGVGGHEHLLWLPRGRRKKGTGPSMMVPAKSKVAGRGGGFSGWTDSNKTTGRARKVMAGTEERNWGDTKCEGKKFQKM